MGHFRAPVFDKNKFLKFRMLILWFYFTMMAYLHTNELVFSWNYRDRLFDNIKMMHLISFYYLN